MPRKAAWWGAGGVYGAQVQVNPPADRLPVAVASAEISWRPVLNGSRCAGARSS